VDEGPAAVLLGGPEVVVTRPSKAGFDSGAYYVHVEVDPLPLRIPLDSWRSYTAFVAPVELEDAATREDAIASMNWTRVPIGQMENAHEDPFMLIEGTDGDVFTAYAEMFDDHNALKVAEIDPGTGSDFLYIREITVKDPFDFLRVGSELVEHVLDEFGGGCFGAAFIASTDEALSLPLRRLLQNRDFRRFGEAGRLYLRQLAFLSPPLPD
jgi:hypothetical protein